MLIRPTAQLHSSFVDSLNEWNGQHQDGAGIHSADQLLSLEGFSDWVNTLTMQESRPSHPGYVCCSYYWIVHEGTFAGSIALRHELNDYLLSFGGHVGYSVRPSLRRLGLATRAVGDIKRIAQGRGMDRLLLTCSEDNVASQRVIRANGGQLDDMRADESGVKRMRFWMNTE